MGWEVIGMPNKNEARILKLIFKAHSVASEYFGVNEKLFWHVPENIISLLSEIVIDNFDKNKKYIPTKIINIPVVFEPATIQPPAPHDHVIWITNKRNNLIYIAITNDYRLLKYYNDAVTEIDVNV